MVFIQRLRCGVKRQGSRVWTRLAVAVAHCTGWCIAVHAGFVCIIVTREVVILGCTRVASDNAIALS